MYGYRSTRRKILKAQERYFFLLKTRLHRKLLAKYIVLQVAAKNTSFITYNWNFFLGLLQHSPCHTQLKMPLTCCKLSILPTGEQVATSLSISSSCNKSVKIRLVENCYLQTCYNLLNKLQPVEIINLQQVCSQLAKGLSSTSCRQPCKHILP